MGCIHNLPPESCADCLAKKKIREIAAQKRNAKQKIVQLKEPETKSPQK